jgi:hypothetical protein
MALSHTHRTGGVTCDLPTKKACDERYSTWKKEQKVAYEATQAERAEQHRTAGELAFTRFAAKEALRVAAVLELTDLHGQPVSTIKWSRRSRH